MTGHPVARSVKTESDGKQEEVAVERERRVEGLVRPRKGQAALKRMKDESLSIRKETGICRRTFFSFQSIVTVTRAPPISVHQLLATDHLYTIPSSILSQGAVA